MKALAPAASRSRSRRRASDEAAVGRLPVKPGRELEESLGLLRGFLGLPPGDHQAKLLRIERWVFASLSAVPTLGRASGDQHVRVLFSRSSGSRGALRTGREVVCGHHLPQSTARWPAHTSWVHTTSAAGPKPAHGTGRGASLPVPNDPLKGDKQMTDSTVPEHYGDYTIIERYQAPAASEEFVLAHAPHRVEPWAVGGGNRQGRYFDEEDRARIEYAHRIAESLGLVLGPPGSVLIPPDERHVLKRHAVAYRKTARAFEQSEAGPDGDGSETAVAMRDAADALAGSLQRLGIIAGVFQDWET